tara:strand:+ start:1816 stop:3111 length:1296 start_codon:yes stop_codon:yes gene_type:complete
MKTLICVSNLKKTDPEIHTLLNLEKRRQSKSIQLIASENVAPASVLECLGSVFVNKYSEGYPGKRYYGGNENVDKVENLAMQRALEAFNLKDKDWGVNVQPYSGSCANLAVYLGLLEPKDKIMGLSLSSGGHLTHGHYTATKKVSASSIIYDSHPYHVDKETGLIDYDLLEEKATKVNPKMIICGYSAYTRDLDYQRFRKIADKCDAYLLADISHFSGLVAARALKSPFKYCDIVTSTTHKTLRGPRGAMIFYKKEFKRKIDFGVFPALQGGPHQNQIAALATQLKMVQTDDYKRYIFQVKRNASVLADELMNYGYKVCTDGTDNHMVLVDLTSLDILGSTVESLCEKVNITLNKNTVPGDMSPSLPHGIRLGSAYMTSLGLSEFHFEIIAKFIHRAILFCLQYNVSEEDLEDFRNEVIHFVDNNINSCYN